MSIKVISNFPLKARQFKKYAKRLGNKVMQDGMFMALEMVGNTAVDEFMKQTSGDVKDDNFFKTAPTGKLLRVRKGKLQRSITNVLDFSTTKYPAKMKKFIKQSGSKGGKKDSIRKVSLSGNKIEGIIGSKVKYAAIHEFGGKAGRNLSVTIPKRSYLTPAVKETMPDIHQMFDEFIHATFNQENI